MKEPKIFIKKKFVLNNQGYYRYYSPYYNYNKKKEVPSVILALNYSSDKYDRVFLNTEKELAVFLKENFGSGEYLVFCFAKKRKGFWVFWRGIVNDDGWEFIQRSYDKSEIKRLEREKFKIIHSKSPQNFDNIDELNIEIQETKELEKEISKLSRYGFMPFLKPSGRRGELHSWGEPDEGYIVKNPIEKRTIDHTKLNIDQLNNF